MNAYSVNVQLLNDDCLIALKTLADNSVDSVITDPPYGLNFMGKEWDRLGDTSADFTNLDKPHISQESFPMKKSRGRPICETDGKAQQDWHYQWAKECLRVLKPGGFLLAFGGSRTYHRLACAVEDAGFEIRDQIMWVYGSGFPKSLNIGKVMDKFLKTGNASWNGTGDSSNGALGYSKLQHKQDYRPEDYSNRHQNKSEITEEKAKAWEGYGTALKPSHEDIVLAQKPLTPVPFYDILSMAVKTIGGALCQLPVFAIVAENHLKLNLRGQKGDVDIARWIAEKSTNISVDLNALMVISQFASEEDTNWNIVSLWLGILNDLCGMANKFTISTENALTTELKILSSLAWRDIFQNIIDLPGNKIDGLNADALIAANLFNAVKLKLTHILTHSAQDPAIFKDALNDLHPNHNPLVLARKPLSEKTVAENCLKWGVGGLAIDECRVNKQEGDRTEYGVNGIKRKTGNVFGKQYGEIKFDGTQGRFPANFIHDGSDEVVELFPNTKAGVAVRHNSGGNTFGGENKKPPMDDIGYGDSGSAARFFYCAKASKRERGEGNNHPTVKSLMLMEYLVKLISREGQIVLDPFMGSGTTGIACINTGRNFIGIEKEKDYFQIAQRRINDLQNNRSK